MKRVFFNTPARTRWCIAAIIVIILLEGCCIPPDLPSSKRKPCNCGENQQPILATNHEPQQYPANALQTAVIDVSNNNISAPVDNSSQSLVLEEMLNWPVDIASDHWKIVLPTYPAFQYMHESPARKAIENDRKKAPFIINKRELASNKLPLGIKGISTSVVAGPNMSFKSSKEDYGNIDHEHKPGVGFQFGVGTAFTFTEKFGVRTSLVFKQCNAKEVLSYSSPGEPGGTITEEFESKYSYNYLSVPILAEIKVSDQLTVTAGPEVNYLVSASVKSEGYGNSDKESITDNSVKVGAGVQLGVRYDIPRSPFGVQLIYDHRISRLNEKNNSDYTPPGGGGNDSPAWNMRSLSLLLSLNLCDIFNKE